MGCASSKAPPPQHGLPPLPQQQVATDVCTSTPLSDEEQDQALISRVSYSGLVALHPQLELLPRDPESGQRATSNPLILNCLMAVYEARKASGDEMPTTATAALEAICNSLCGAALRRLLQVACLDAQAAQRQVIEDHQLDEAALALERPETLAAVRAELLTSSFAPSHESVTVGQVVQVLSGEHAGRHGVVVAVSKGGWLPYEVRVVGASSLGGSVPSNAPVVRLSPEEIVTSGLSELQYVARAMEAGRARLREACGYGHLSEPTRDALVALRRLGRRAAARDELPLLRVVRAAPMQLEAAHPSLQAYLAARAIADGARVPPPPPWQWGDGWDEVLRLGGELGPPFVQGLLRACGANGGELAWSGKLQRSGTPSGPPNAQTPLAAVALVLPSLTELDLSRNGIDSAGGEAIGRALRSGGGSVRTLDLYGNSVGAEGAVAIAEALEGNASLLSLDLYRNCVGDEGGVAVGEMLARNGALTDLNLSGNELGAESGAKLALALATNCALTDLNLYRNRLGPEGCAELASALGRNGSMRTLNVADNELCGLNRDGVGVYTADAVRAFAAALRASVPLRTLLIGLNAIGDEGAAVVADALGSGAALEELDVRDNRIGVEGGKALASALRRNRCLGVLNLSDNGIEQAGGEAMAEALRVNTEIRRLDFTGNFRAREQDQLLCHAQEMLRAAAAGRASLTVVLATGGCS